jgi:hypothetical protein
MSTLRVDVTCAATAAVEHGTGSALAATVSL